MLQHATTATGLNYSAPSIREAVVVVVFAAIFPSIMGMLRFFVCFFLSLIFLLQLLQIDKVSEESEDSKGFQPCSRFFDCLNSATNCYKLQHILFVAFFEVSKIATSCNTSKTLLINELNKFVTIGTPKQVARKITSL
jgi:hypothetical protein